MAGLQGTPDTPSEVQAGVAADASDSQAAAPSNHVHSIETAAPSVKVSYDQPPDEGAGSALMRASARLSLEDGLVPGDILQWNGTVWVSVPPPSAAGGGQPGFDGEDGNDGIPGAPGAPGATGSPGATGPAGIGFPGQDGEDGIDGLPGPQGPRGDTGPMGTTGPAGIGFPGQDGEDGLDGLQGPQGPKGDTGPMGPSGPPGLDGVDGEDGAIGPTGPQGAPGAPGSGSSGTATIDFGAFPGASDASVVVTGEASIASDSVVHAWIALTSTADHSADEHLLETIKVAAGNIVAGVGFTIYALNNSELFEPLEAPKGDRFKALAAQSQGGLRASVGGQGTRIYGQWTVSWSWR